MVWPVSSLFWSGAYCEAAAWPIWAAVRFGASLKNAAAQGWNASLRGGAFIIDKGYSLR